MYRIAVIQNGIEMQHSGYVDAISMYKDFSRIGKEKAEFTRFSGVNIRDLFSLGQYYLMDFDALIIGTNATSDDDVYRVLREESSRVTLEEFIEKGKGVLICSQKKFQPKEEESTNAEYKYTVDAKNDDFIRILENTGKGSYYCKIEEVKRNNSSKQRVTGFLPAHYEYIVDERPSVEGSKDGFANIVPKERCTLNQKCVLSLPNLITNECIDKHCSSNSFQTHYYRDHIIPLITSAYQPLIIDPSHDSTRSLVMIAVPQNKERIVISTMALDWAGHYELLENIVNYLTRGVPHTALIHKNGKYNNNEMKILAFDAEMSKIGYVEYGNLEDFLNNISWHSLAVFSPDYSETEVLDAWKIIKTNTMFTKAYHYKKIGEELVLVKYSSNAYIEQQKMDVISWLNSKRGIKLWDNSFWKTYDVAKLYYSMGIEGCPAIIGQIVNAVVECDDKSKHYRKDGSYDGVLAPTCGVMELLFWAISCSTNTVDKLKYTEYYNKTKEYLLERFRTENSITHNKMFIIRTFYHCKDRSLKGLIRDFSLKDGSYNDLIDIDLCLYAEIELVLFLYNKANKNIHKNHIISILETLLARQMQNGKWDSLSNTASILTFILQNLDVFKKSILNGSSESEIVSELQSKTERGIAAIKTAYSSRAFNWENNIVTTSNALLALYLYDNNSDYKSKDFLRSFVGESNESANYNALSLALNTLDSTIEELTEKTDELNKEKKLIEDLQVKNTKYNRRLYFVSSVAGFSLLGLISVFIWVGLKNFAVLKAIVSEVFMWIPIVIGMAIPPIVMFAIKKFSNISDKNSGIESKQ